ncbi:MAG TPA: LptF/LptG family permease [Candidatus Egerieousia sp.]|nr:LptF/LptG family permease [Candidatus Egerieousia sp.]HPT05119.1 LptF/LptG family permease [Candidatus Egerieousia sp.]
MNFKGKKISLNLLHIKTMDLYMLKSFLGPFILTFLIVTFILMMQFLWLYIDELVGKGLSFGIIVEFMGWGCCTLIPLALPLATLLASIMTMGNLGENSELLAMKAAGISLQRIMMPLSYVAVFIVVGAFFASNNLIPVAYNKIYTLREDIGKTKDEIKIPTGVFYSGIDGYTIRITKRDKNDLMHGIMVYNHTKDNGNVDLTVADSGRFSLSEDKKSLLIVLHHGTNYQETNKINFADTSLAVQKIQFKYQMFAIPLQNYAFQKSDKARYGNEVMAKNLKQLKHDRDSLTKEYSKSLDMQTSRALAGDILVHTDQLDSARNKGYKKSVSPGALFKWTNKNQERNAYREAISNLEVQKNTAEFYAAELYNSAYPLRRTKIESYRKFTLSIACLIFFFIGAPIGAIVRKGGLGTPAIISILFFVLYWVVDISGKKLANDGAIGPFEGAFISTLVLAPIGAFLTWKSTRDSALFNPEVILNNISNFFKGLFSKAKRLQLKLEKEEQRKEAEREDREWHEREAREKTSADTNNSLKSNLTANDKL